MRQIAIIDVGSGNLYSVEKATRHVADADTEVKICAQADQLADATHIILPGVGAFANCMAGLNDLPNMREALEQQVLRDGKPFLGICVGMQMLLERGLEHGITEGLGWFKGEVRPLLHNSGADKKRGQQAEPALSVGEANSPCENQQIFAGQLKIPHMGWNELKVQKQHPLLDGIETGDHAYFVHSYHCVMGEDVVAASVDYGGEVTAAIARDNIFATQFHPEKSQKTGLRILQNFLKQCHAS